MEISKLESRKTIENFNYTKFWFFENIKKIDKPLLSLIKERWK